MNSDSPTCVICVEPLGKKAHVVVKCPYCPFEACRKCCETFLLSNEEPKCMETKKCGKTWSRAFLVANFTQSFLSKTYKEHREKIFFEKEQALLPATQEVITRQKLDAKRTAIANILRCVHVQKIQDFNAKTPVLTDEEMTQFIAMFNRLSDQRQELNQELNADTYATPATTTHVKRIFNHRCGDGECRGFLSSQWKCGMCDKTTCKDCNIVKITEDHICKPDDVATARMIARDSKPCPKCTTPISKIDGCDQMWCTQCHTAFSWTRGVIETNIHNPHYFEWVRRTGGNAAVPRNPADIQCGRAIDHRFTTETNLILRRYIGYKQQPQIDRSYVDNFIRSLMHIRHVELDRYRVNNVLDNERLRIEYMTKVIDEPKFKILVQREHIKFEKKKEISDILGMFVQTSTDILYRYHDALKNPNSLSMSEFENSVNAIIAELKALVVFTNECFEVTSDTFKSIVLQITVGGEHVLAGKPKEPVEPKVKGKKIVAAQVVDLTDA